MLQLDAHEVAARLGRVPLIDALDRAFRAEVHAPERRHYAVGGSPDSKDTLLIMPAWQTGGLIGVKLVTVFPGNTAHARPAVHASYTVFDAANGVPVAVLDGTELTRRRTAAASALAARYLARPDASRLLMVGTGALAPHLIESHAAVRPIESVRVWGRRIHRARDIAQGFAGRMDVEAVDDLEAAVRWADIISCATLAGTPLVHGAWLKPGQHLDLVGAFTSAMREADDDALLRANIHVDTRAGALAESGELLHAIASGAMTAANIRAELRDLARGTVLGRRSPEEITLFKSVGSAIEDLAAAELALRGAGPQRPAI
ncbi:MAG: ornithine cyclodeaminase family protein [Steroidobacteraceae bacterium]|jgi:ornithine cyclodeaminase